MKRKIFVAIVVFLFTIWATRPLISLLVEVRHQQIKKQAVRERIEQVCSAYVTFGVETSLKECVERRMP